MPEPNQHVEPDSQPDKGSSEFVYENDKHRFSARTSHRAFFRLGALAILAGTGVVILMLLSN